MILEAINITKSFKGQNVLRNVSFHLNNNEHVGLIGDNGTGKSTLLKILAGLCSQDTGYLNWTKKNVEIAFLKQENTWNPNLKLCDQISNISDYWMNVFGITNNMLDKKVQYLSGGEKTRASLAWVFSKNPDLLLLDEPTNHLDIEGMILLEEIINDFSGSILIVSHERTFLDNTVKRILELNNGILTSYKGNYSSYILQLQEKSERIRRDYNKYLKEKRRLEEAIIRRKQIAERSQKKANKVSRDDHRNAKAYYGSASKRLMNTAKAMETRLQRLHGVKPKEKKVINLDFESTGKTGSKIFVADNISFYYNSGEYIFKNASFNVQRGDKIAIIGKNGCGKTTLVKLLIGELAPTEGTIYSPPLVPGYLEQELENLNSNNTIIQEALKTKREESKVRKVLSDLLFNATDLKKRIIELSGGEKLRMAIAKLLLLYPNLLILDEPTNQMDISSKEIIEEALINYSGTILFVTHDRYLIKRVANKILSIKDKKVEFYHGDYDSFYNRPKYTSLEIQEKRLLLENKLAKISGELATASTNDDLERLNKEFLNVSRMLNQLKEL
ncbi:MAG: ribosomal protection-like ABC-F family protein [Tuberibacillus sp.]